jgi:hypothetical protein
MLSPDETCLTGKWFVHGDGVVADDICVRIGVLASGQLAQLAQTSDGWSKLFRDPADGRLWEHSYPQAEIHGGGPPSLQCISSQAARAKYGVTA